MSPFGAVLILMGSLGCAWNMSREEKQRLQTLRELSAAVSALGAELSLHLTDLPQLTGLMAERAPGDAGRFFTLLAGRMEMLGERSFSSLWQEVARETLKHLDGDSLAVFLNLGDTLGRYEVGEQLAALEGCRTALDRAAEELSAALPDRRRISFGLWSAAGALLAILLI